MSDTEGSAPPREELASQGFVKGLCLGLAIGSMLAAFGFVAIATRRDESDWVRGAVWCFGGGVLTVAVVALAQTSRVLALSVAN